MLEILTWIVLSYITQISEKYGFDKKWMIIILSIFAWWIYYLAEIFYPELTESIWKSTLEIYWVSQIVYNYIIKQFKTKE